MNASEFTSKDNNRADAIAKLQAFCHSNGWDYKYGIKEFKVKLPATEPLPKVTERPTKTKRTSFNTDNWPTADVDETLPDELPPAEYNLEEGQPPEEPKE